MNELKERALELRRRVSAACERAQRSVSSVQVLAVSKRQPIAALREAYELGFRDFGENYVQELAEKGSALGDLSELRLHMIGHLQSNKVAAVLPHITALHTLDSLKLAAKLNQAAERLKRTLEVFIAVNAAGEAQKHGCSLGELSALVDAAGEASHLKLVGLMSIPPRVTTPEESRPYFAQLRELGQKHGAVGLSMGMSADFEVAIEEGATHIRVGSTLFGARPT